MFIGIVGKPSVGKSTFFKAATLAEVDIANYPFTTIKPNSAMGYVKIKDVAQELGNKQPANPREGFVAGSYRFVPVELVDVAGLVPGAHEGLGMGNQFLNDLSGADVLIHVIDVSGSVNEKGEPCEPLSYDPAKDIAFLENELDYWFKSLLTKGWDKFSKQVMQLKEDLPKSLAKFLTGLKVSEDHVKKALNTLSLPPSVKDWTDEDLLQLARELRKMTKPMVIAANKIDVPGAVKNLERLKQEFKEYHIIGCSAESELALREAAKHGLIEYVPGEKEFTIKDESKLSDAQRKALEYIQKNILDVFSTTGVQDVLNTSVFDVLGYIALHPGGAGKLEDKDGNRLPDCFLMPSGTTALDFAYRLHTDFGKNFIRAVDVKTRMTVGKDHKLKHLDILEIAAGK
ncbi:redox-regulated ATPase YchF [Candidatus Woesearchaeota archaeon]|nr:MAG: redox-regulated ATPase YchF [Candidatus Woesearchaeota archaeon]